MELFDKKNSLIIFAGAMVVLTGFIAMSLIQKPSPAQPTQFDREIKQIETQSDSDEISAIEKDLMQTDLNNLDKELEDIENELEAAY
jgi:hypothetical protein